MPKSGTNMSMYESCCADTKKIVAKKKSVIWKSFEIMIGYGLEISKDLSSKKRRGFEGMHWQGRERDFKAIPAEFVILISMVKKH